MPVSADYLAYVVDQFAPFAKVVARRMFGAMGLYADGSFFAIIDDDTLYLKVDDSNRGDYAARGARPLQPRADDPTCSMNYFQLPQEVLEDPDELRHWARKSIAIATAKALSKRSKKKKSARRTAPVTKKK